MMRSTTLVLAAAAALVTVSESLLRADGLAEPVDAYCTLA